MPWYEYYHCFLRWICFCLFPVNKRRIKQTNPLYTSNVLTKSKSQWSPNSTGQFIKSTINVSTFILHKYR